MNRFLHSSNLLHLLALFGLFLAAMDLHGSLFQTDFAVTAGPVVADSRLYFGDGAGWVYSLDLRSGKHHWRHHFSAAVTGISIVGNYLAASTYSEGVPQDNLAHILATDTGKLLWSLPLAEQHFHDPVLIANKLVVWSVRHPALIRSYPIAGGPPDREIALPEDEWLTGNDSQNSQLLLLGSKSGLHLFSLPTLAELWHLQISAHGIVTVLSNGDTVLYQCDGVLHCMATVTGQPYPWRWPLTGEIAGVTEVRGKLVVAEDGASVHALDRGTGKVLWQFHVDGTNDAQAVVEGGGKLFFDGGAKGIFALAEADGRLLWNFPVQRDNWPIIFQGDRLYFADERDQINAVDADLGRLLWAKPLGHRAAGNTPLVVSGSVIMATLDGRVLSFNAVTGNPQWEFRTRANAKYRKKLHGMSSDALQISGNGKR